MLFIRTDSSRKCIFAAFPKLKFRIVFLKVWDHDRACAEFPLVEDCEFFRKFPHIELRSWRDNCWMCVDQHNVLSTYNPRYFTVCWRFKGVEFRIKLRFVLQDFEGTLFVVIQQDLEKFKDNLLFLIQVSIFLSSLFALSSGPDKLLSLRVKKVSSANRVVPNWLTSGRSFMCNKKRRRPKDKLWGTPHVIFPNFDLQGGIFAFCYLLNR